MAKLKLQTWFPDTHPGYIIEVEWEYDAVLGRDTGREHRCVSFRYPDGTYIQRDTHGADEAQKHYLKLLAEHIIKNLAYRCIVDSLPPHMKKPVLDSDGEPVLEDTGQSRLTIKDKHRPEFENLGDGRYKCTVPGLDEATHEQLAAKLTDQFGGAVALAKPLRKAANE